jgi:hypothetical protein
MVVRSAEGSTRQRSKATDGNSTKEKAEDHVRSMTSKHVQKATTETKYLVSPCLPLPRVSPAVSQELWKVEGDSVYSFLLKHLVESRRRFRILISFDNLYSVMCSV